MCVNVTVGLKTSFQYSQMMWMGKRLRFATSTLLFDISLFDHASTMPQRRRDRRRNRKFNLKTLRMRSLPDGMNLWSMNLGSTGGVVPIIQRRDANGVYWRQRLTTWRFQYTSGRYHNILSKPK